MLIVVAHVLNIAIVGFVVGMIAYMDPVVCTTGLNNLGGGIFLALDKLLLPVTYRFL
jgi:hypothetical protein